MEDISGFGAQVQIVASNTYPAGFTVTQFADDADPFDIPSVQIADKAMGLNGDLIVWAKANPINITIDVIPNGPDDINLAILLEANRVGRGKLGAADVITISCLYPDGTNLVLLQGRITDGMPGSAIASSGRLKTKPYIFCFENKINN